MDIFYTWSSVGYRIFCYSFLPYSINKDMVVKVNNMSKYRVVLEVNIEKGGVSIEDFVEIGLNNFNKANESIIQATVLEVEEEEL